ncbi:glycosyltransferase [Campylobacter curvus]|uniref:glycosyltransferase n=1 Tax=Campylobacter curvus TaxID=200 RepID=UPI0014701EF6|nr:glycosyltransferase [Campylobacter curvus]
MTASANDVLPYYPNRHPKDASHIKLSYVTHFYCNQKDINSVISLLREYETYDPRLLDIMEFIIVDDGSPIEYEIPKFDLNLRWLKINEDIPWNQAGARNLGMTYARSDKVLITDLDHLFYEDTLWYMANHKPLGRKFYKIYRDFVGYCAEERVYKGPLNLFYILSGKKKTIYKGHTNTFFISRARYMRLFGYDEEFAGHYGSEDFRFVKFQKAHGSIQGYLPIKYLCKERSSKKGDQQFVDRDLSYHSLDRDLSYNTPVDARKKRENREFGAEYGHSRIFLNFTWKILYENMRKNIPQPEQKRWWYYLWYVRWIFGYR